MNKYAFTSLLLLVLLSTFTWTIMELLKQDVPTIVWIAVLIPFIIGGILIWLLRDLVPQKKLRAIRHLAEDIKVRTEESLTTIQINDAPEEIVPLIKSINRLIKYYEDRYKQERDFTANASHELRTPLAGIRLQTEIAMKSERPEQRLKAYNNILKSVDRGTRLVEQLLILSRLTAERVDLAMEAINFGKLAAKVVAEYHGGLAEKCGIDLHMGAWGNAMIEGSEQSIEILVDNLVRNALTYTPEGGIVEVSVTHDKGGVMLKVLDNGHGIAEDKREQVLRRFEKADKGSKTGTGLGLSIVKRITELHGGTLELGTGLNGKGLGVTVIFGEYSKY